MPRRAGSGENPVALDQAAEQLEAEFPDRDRTAETGARAGKIALMSTTKRRVAPEIPTRSKPDSEPEVRINLKDLLPGGATTPLLIFGAFLALAVIWGFLGDIAELGAFGDSFGVVTSLATFFALIRHSINPPPSASRAGTSTR